MKHWCLLLKTLWFDRLPRLTAHGNKAQFTGRCAIVATSVVDTFVCFGFLTVVFWCVCSRTDILHHKPWISNVRPCRSSLRTAAKQPEGFWVSTNYVIPRRRFSVNCWQFLWQQNYVTSDHAQSLISHSTVFVDMLYWKLSSWFQKASWSVAFFATLKHYWKTGTLWGRRLESSDPGLARVRVRDFDTLYRLVWRRWYFTGKMSD